MIPKINRLTRKKDFDCVFKKGKSFKGDFLVLKYVFNETGKVRFGIVVSKKISKKAVVRNKIKRRIRAAINTRMVKFEKGADAILLALPGLETKKFQEIEKTIDRLFKKAKLIKNV